MNKSFILIFILQSLIFYGCGQLKHLNTHPHHYGTIPHKIIWFQIPGLDEQQLTLLKFFGEQNNEKLSLEQFNCVGKFWNYNLYKIHPSPIENDLTQITGSKNIKDECNDYNYLPLWKKVPHQIHFTGIIEHNVDYTQSVRKSLNCDVNQRKFLNESVLWVRNKKEKRDKNGTIASFQYPYTQEFKMGDVYFDQSCQNSECQLANGPTLQNLYFDIKKNYNRFLLIIRDHSLLKVLHRKNISDIKGELEELEKTWTYFVKEAGLDQHTLLLITSASSQIINYPGTGPYWKNIQELNKSTIITRPNVMGSSYSLGARAENFCGIFDEAEIVPRLIFRPD